MVVSLKGDKDFENLLSVKDKALRINLNENIYCHNIYTQYHIYRKFISE